MFVIVGNSGIIVTSADGNTWQVRTSTVSNGLTSTAYGNEMFVSVGGNGTILTSPDGSTWTKQTINNITGYFYRVIYEKSFLIVGEDGIFYGDGFTCLQLSTIKNLTRIIYGNNLYVAMGKTTILTSTDRIYWTARTSVLNDYWTDIAYGNNSYAIVGNSPTTIATSPDGITWTKQTHHSSAPLSNIIYGKNIFVFMGTGKIFACDISTAISLL